MNIFQTDRGRWLLVLSLILLLSLTACGKAEPLDSSSDESTLPDVSALAPVEIEPEPEPEPEPLPYVNPLTGEGCKTDVVADRPVAIMLNNLKKALPQTGVSQADIIYEILAEGGITRMLGVFQSVEGVGEIGTVRSARDYYVSLAYGMDAIFLHAGGSPQAYSSIKSWGVTAMDCVNGPYEGSLFWRDQTRRRNAGLEHSVLTSGEKITELFPTYKSLRRQHKEDFVCPMVFSDNAAPKNGLDAQTITVKFSSYKTGVFRYDSEQQMYWIEEYNAPYIDGATGEQVAVKNVLVLNTDISVISGDTAGRLTVRTTGSGSGYFACDGKYQEITWSKKSHASPMTFQTADGKDLVFGIGPSYINIIGKSSSCTFEGKASD